MKKSIFREKSIERISSPEQFDEYVKVSNPSVWVLLTAIIILLMGFLYWSIFGRLSTTIPVAVVSTGDQVYCYVLEDDSEEIVIGKEVVLDNIKLAITGISSTPEYVAEDDNATVVHILESEDDVWTVKCVLDGSLPEGTYEAELVTDSIAPITFITN